VAVKKMRDKDDFRANGLLAGSIAADFNGDEDFSKRPLPFSRVPNNPLEKNSWWVKVMQTKHSTTGTHEPANSFLQAAPLERLYPY
jgi:hypothetical protein